MASTNRHWPSMFKSKPTHQDHQWLQSHASNIGSSSNYTSGCDERTPEPKPRWNPKPEQIRILESIFNSGMVNPPRDEIKKIRSRLQEYGQLGDANVFYWFQNRKSRSKNKTHHLQKSRSRRPQPVYAAATTSSPSSSDKSSSKSAESFLLNSPTVSINQHHGEFFQESFFFPVVQQASMAHTSVNCTQEFCFPEISTMIDHENHRRNNDQMVVSSTGMLFTDLIMSHQHGIPNYNNTKSKGVEEENIIIDTLISHNTQPPPPSPACTSITPPPPAVPTPVLPPAPTSTITPSTINDVQDDQEAGMQGKLIVFVNDVPFEVAVGPFNIKEAFGSDAVLIDSSGQTVVANDWGVTTQSLQHGAFYYIHISSCCHY